MAGNTFGQAFRVTTFGESHGEAVGAIVDGCPAGLVIDEHVIQQELDRRRPGQSNLVTQRREPDVVEIVSGLHAGRTLGTPICLLVRNVDIRAGDYEAFREVFRPGHADMTYAAKYGLPLQSGGGRASARETAGRVAASAIARHWLALAFDVEIIAWVASVGDVTAEIDPASRPSRAQVDDTPVRCPDPEAAVRMIEAIQRAKAEGDSIGGVVGFSAFGVPAGWGEPVFDKLEADFAKAMLSIPAAKGFDIGSGFDGTRMRGSEHNDALEAGPKGEPQLASNRAGGVLGGISCGSPIFGRVAFKPTSTIAHPQQTLDVRGQPTVLRGKGRHDPCVLPRAVPVVEAMAALVLADHALRQAGFSSTRLTSS